MHARPSECLRFRFDITEGMKFELAYAAKKKKPVRLYDDSFNAVNVRTLAIDIFPTGQSL